MKYRPKGWSNPYGEYTTGPILSGVTAGDFYRIYEAGADAFCDLLFKLAKESPTGTFIIDSNEVTITRGF